MTRKINITPSSVGAHPVDAFLVLGTDSCGAIERLSHLGKKILL